MRNLLALIGLVVVVFGGVGWYRGWYQIDHQASDDGKTQLQVNIDSRRIGSDAQSAFRQGGEFLQELSESRKEDERKAADGEDFVGPPRRGSGSPPPASLPGPAPRGDDDWGTWWAPRGK